MTTPPRAPDPNRPQASRGEKVRNAKSDQYGGVGHGIGEAPNSRLKKIGILIVVFLVILFIILDFVDRANAKKKKNSYHYAPTADMPTSRTA